MKKYGSGNQPFMPIGGDIPEGHPDELTHSTNQLANNQYGEMKTFVESSGQTLTALVADDPQQVAKAAFIYSARANYFTALNSTANTKILTPLKVGIILPALSLLDGCEFKFKNKAKNTGAVTVMVNGVGMTQPLPLVNSDGSALVADDMQDAVEYAVRYDASIASFVLLVTQDKQYVGYIPQSLTEAQRTQALSNLGILDLVKNADHKNSAVAVITSSSVALSGIPVAANADGVTLAAGDRVLRAVSPADAANGLYVVAAGAWTRATDADESDKVTSGMEIAIEQGTLYKDIKWTLTTDGAIVLGTTALLFATKVIVDWTPTIASLSTSTSTALATSVSSVSSLSTSVSTAIDTTNSSISSLSTAIYDSRFVGMIIASPTENPLPGTIKLNGACINVSVYSRLAAAIYCGDAKNETAVSCYKCTDVGGTIRSTTGIYLKLPEYRAEFMRFWDDGRGVDVGREINSYQLDAIQNITGFINGIQNSPSMTLGGAGGAFAQVDNLVNGNDNSGGAPVFNMTFDASRVVRTATETRSRNVAPLACIVY